MLDDEGASLSAPAALAPLHPATHSQYQAHNMFAERAVESAARQCHHGQPCSFGGCLGAEAPGGTSQHSVHRTAVHGDVDSSSRRHNTHRRPRYDSCEQACTARSRCADLRRVCEYPLATVMPRFPHKLSSGPPGALSDVLGRRNGQCPSCSACLPLSPRRGQRYTQSVCLHPEQWWRHH